VGTAGFRCISPAPLLQAALAGKLEVVRYLVKEFGVDIHQVDENGYFALYIAAQQGHEALVRCIVQELGADVKQARHDVCTPLFIAAQMGHEFVVRCIVKELGADVNQEDMDGCTPLFITVKKGHESVVRCMVKELGADVNKSTHDGSTPLMVAAYKHKFKIVTFLLKYGADAQASASDGTAADISKQKGAPAEQATYLEARTHCANSGCSGAGLKKCAGCLVVFFCGRPCQLAHWSAHKAECKKTMLRAGEGN
jgi:ankyrin repeat protein